MWNCCLPPLFVLRGKKAVGFYILLAHIGDSVYITNWWGAVVLVVFSTFVQMCSKTTLIMSENLWTTCFVFFLCLSGRAHTAQREREKKRKRNLSFRVELFCCCFFFCSNRLQLHLLPDSTSNWLVDIISNRSEFTLHRTAALKVD